MDPLGSHPIRGTGPDRNIVVLLVAMREMCCIRICKRKSGEQKQARYVRGDMTMAFYSKTYYISRGAAAEAAFHCQQTSFFRAIDKRSVEHLRTHMSPLHEHPHAHDQMPQLPVSTSAQTATPSHPKMNHHSPLDVADNMKLTLALAAKALLQGLIGAACLVYVGWWFVSPEPASNDRQKYPDSWARHRMRSRFFATHGRAGSAFVFQSIPFIVITVLSCVLIGFRGFIKSVRGHGRPAARFSLRAFPICISRTMGVVSAAELLAVLGVMLVILYHFGRVMSITSTRIDANTIVFYEPTTAPKPWVKLNYASHYAATVALFPFSLLWFPISRGSPFMRLIGVPFERAVQYHIWLAVLTLTLLTFHGVGYIVYYVKIGKARLIYSWATGRNESAVLAGVIALLVGLVIWAVSLNFVRRRLYTLFFVLHHLYALFFLFWLYHAIWSYQFFVIPALLFVVDRFVRLIQSRRLVDVLYAKLHESGAVELRFPVDDSSCSCPLYNTISKWCIEIPGLSRLQWHFFSTASSSLDRKKAVSIIIKPRGGWTNALWKEFHVSSDQGQCPSAVENSRLQACSFSFKARVEGPYADESDFYLKYKRLILVGGGVGLSPLLAMIEDILYRYKSSMGKSDSKKYLPKSIVLYHCVKKPEELCILNSRAPGEILPGYHESYGLSIRVHVYLTSKDKKDYKEVEGGDRLDTMNLLEFRDVYPRSMQWPLTFHHPPPPTPSNLVQFAGISRICITGNIIWVTSTIVASISGYLVFSGLANHYIVTSYANFSNYNRAHLLVASMILGTVIFGGSILLLWFLSTLKKSKKDSDMQREDMKPDAYNSTFSVEASKNPDHVDGEAYGRSEMFWNGDLHFHCRPDWRDVFNGFITEFRGECVGVVASGPPSLQEDIARECRRSFTSNICRKQTIFHHYSFTAEF